MLNFLTQKVGLWNTREKNPGEASSLWRLCQKAELCKQPSKVNTASPAVFSWQANKSSRQDNKKEE